MLKFFKLHVSDYGEALLGMPDENVGKIIKGLIEYAMDKEQTPIDDPNVLGLCTVMKLHIGRDEDYRQNKINAGRSGGLAKSSKTKQNVAKRSKGVAEISTDVAEDSNVKQSLPPYPNPYPYPNPNNNSLVEEVVKYLNEKTKSHYQAKGKTYDLINARLNDGFTVDDCKKVIDKKSAEWKDTPYEKFIRPSTLFAPSHFEEYLNQPDNVNTSVKPNSFTAGVMSRDIDFEALERQLVKN